jgi:hypothetical protein
MTRTFIKIGIFGAALALPLGGCASAPVSGPVVYRHCAGDFHTEAFPRNINPKKAYGCRSNQSGFLSTDEKERMRPL